MIKFKRAVAALAATCALAAFSLPASAAHFGGGGGHMGGGFHGGGHFGGGHFGGGHFAGGGHWHGGGGWHGGHGWRGRGWGYYPGFAFYGGPYYDDYYGDDYDYCYWRHGRRFCRY